METSLDNMEPELSVTLSRIDGGGVRLGGVCVHSTPNLDCSSFGPELTDSISRRAAARQVNYRALLEFGWQHCDPPTDDTQVIGLALNCY